MRFLNHLVWFCLLLDQKQTGEQRCGFNLRLCLSFFTFLQPIDHCFLALTCLVDRAEVALGATERRLGGI